MSEPHPEAPPPGAPSSVSSSAAASATPPPKPTEPVAVNQLTPEEQMALFEKELKENDWGHQPC